MNTSFVKKIAIGVLGLTLFGCSESPMQALESDHLEPKYDKQYWLDIAKNDPQLYTQAVQYCHQNPQKPNCAALYTCPPGTMTCNV